MNAATTTARPRYFVGLQAGKRSVFRYAGTPTAETHGARFAAVIGPFRTRRGADFMAAHGGNGNPHVRTVNEAEHAARGEAYDLVTRKWVRTRAAMEAAGKGAS